VSELSKAIFIPIYIAIVLMPALPLFVFIFCRKRSGKRKMPVQKVWRLDMFQTYEPDKVVWKVPATTIQSGCEYPCEAFSLFALMKSPAIALKYPPSIPDLINDLLFKDMSAARYLEIHGLIGKTNFLVRFLRRFGISSSIFRFDSTREIKDYVRQYSPAMVTIILPFEAKVNDQKVLCNVTGWKPEYHSVLVYGFDENFACPDGSRGAFRVRWHLDWRGNDGWIPFNIAEKIFNSNCSFGYRY
jgi:hypothetical protein